MRKRGKEEGKMKGGRRIEKGKVKENGGRKGKRER